MYISRNLSKLLNNIFTILDQNGGYIMVEFSENTRVKIPALVHATRLCYEYLSL